ncbi:DinB family protein [Spirosoma sp. HMF3257]|uniref:DinB family protein n=1 Tax=Spirosoma telluris TaxID=2183553 RepID=A0A327NEL0_9BACT|nr:DinB family protein [Spirosoma telluris]RAI73355.1 DinB family protein [Spirosoma telluris]
MQTKTPIQQRLSADYQAFIKVADSLTEEQFHKNNDDKWSVADVMQHLYLSARPIVRLMTGPRDVLRQWGEANSPSRDYDDIASAYRKILATGVKAPAAMLPRVEDMQAEKSELMMRFTGIYQTLIDAVGTWSDLEVDSYCIPHPVLGKLTVREMLIFTSVHTQHHLRLLPEV